MIIMIIITTILLYHPPFLLNIEHVDTLAIDTPPVIGQSKSVSVV